MSESDRPVLRVVRGEPTQEELAALVIAIAMKQRSSAASMEPGSGWRDRAPLLRKPVFATAGAWRAAARESGARTRAAW